MKKSRYPEAQIVLILKEGENGVHVFELCRTQGMSSAAFFPMAFEVRLHRRIFDFRDEAVAG